MQKASRTNNKSQQTKTTVAKRSFTTAHKKQKTSKLAAKKSIHTKSKRNIHVAVIGAAGGIGQPLAMLLKQNQNDLFTKLSVYDVNPVVTGVAADLSHIPTSVQVTGFTDLDAALQGADIVVVPAGVPRKPGMTRDDLFNTNAKINFTIASAVAKNCPNAKSLIISNPVNSMVPLWAEVFKAKGTYDPAKLMGVTTLDVFRATTFSFDKMSADQNTEAVPVIGGHAGTTIVPLFSARNVSGSSDEMAALVKRTMFGGDEVVQAKAGGGSATLSMAAAGARFTESVAHAMKAPTAHAKQVAQLLKKSGNLTEMANISHNKFLSECDYAFVENPAAKKAFGTEFFASGVILAEGGVAAIHSTWEAASPVEHKLVTDMVADLKSQIEKGQEWAQTELAKQ
jgi:NAD-dependent malate dehydrogenase